MMYRARLRDVMKHFAFKDVGLHMGKAVAETFDTEWIILNYSLTV